MHRTERGSIARHLATLSRQSVGNEDDQQETFSTRHNSTRDQRCNICSYRQSYPAVPAPIHHRHFSSAQHRELLGVETTGARYFCPSCKSNHRPYLDDRIKVVVSDSTLHEFFAPSNHTHGTYEGDLIHSDYVTIAEGTIEQLLHAFKLEYVYMNRPKPLDVVLVAGYADAVKGYSREHILWGMSTFADTVMMHNGRRTLNTFAVASLMYPPSLCWFSDDGPIPYRYQNQLEKFEWLNAEIHNLNAHYNSPVYPGFHSFGTRKSIKKVFNDDGSQQQQHCRAHRWEHWSETARREKFTLRSDRKFKMGKAVNNYFVFRT